MVKPLVAQGSGCCPLKFESKVWIRGLCEVLRKLIRARAKTKRWSDPGTMLSRRQGRLATIAPALDRRLLSSVNLLVSSRLLVLGDSSRPVIGIGLPGDHRPIERGSYLPDAPSRIGMSRLIGWRRKTGFTPPPPRALEHGD